MNRITNWSGYFDFLAIVKAGSISAAARAMGVTQPTLSRRLSQLEGDLGVRLLLRTPTGLALTPAGERMLSTLRQVNETIGTMEAEIHAGDVALRGAVRITATETLAITWLVPLIAEFNEAYPQIRVELAVDNAMVNLLGREAHIAIRLLRPSDGDLIARHLGNLHISLYCARTYARRYGCPATEAEARDHRAVGLLGITPTAVLTEKIFTVERHAFQSNSLLAVYRAIQSGLGIGPVLNMLADRDPDLEHCLPAARMDKEVWLTAVPELRESARLRAVYDFLADRLRTDTLPAA